MRNFYERLFLQNTSGGCLCRLLIIKSLKLNFIILFSFFRVIRILQLHKKLRYRLFVPKIVILTNFKKILRTRVFERIHVLRANWRPFFKNLITGLTICTYGRIRIFLRHHWRWIPRLLAIEVYLKPCQRSMMELFNENIWWRLTVNSFSRKAPSCMIDWVWIRYMEKIIFRNSIGFPSPSYLRKHFTFQVFFSMWYQKSTVQLFPWNRFTGLVCKV